MRQQLGQRQGQPPWEKRHPGGAFHKIRFASGPVDRLLSQPPGSSTSCPSSFQPGWPLRQFKLFNPAWFSCGISSRGGQRAAFTTSIMLSECLMKPSLFLTPPPPGRGGQTNSWGGSRNRRGHPDFLLQRRPVLPKELRRARGGLQQQLREPGSSPCLAAHDVADLRTIFCLALRDLTFISIALLLIPRLFSRMLSEVKLRGNKWREWVGGCLKGSVHHVHPKHHHIARGAMDYELKWLLNSAATPQRSGTLWKIDQGLTTRRGRAMCPPHLAFKTTNW